jgi:hypothetical protein
VVRGREPGNPPAPRRERLRDRTLAKRSGPCKPIGGWTRHSFWSAGRGIDTIEYPVPDRLHISYLRALVIEYVSPQQNSFHDKRSAAPRVGSCRRTQTDHETTKGRNTRRSFRCQRTRPGTSSSEIALGGLIRFPQTGRAGRAATGPAWCSRGRSRVPPARLPRSGHRRVPVRRQR